MSTPELEHDDEVEASRAPLMAHLEELRDRLIWALGAVVIGFVICFIFAEWIYNVLLVPFEDAARQGAALTSWVERPSSQNCARRSAP